MYPYQAALVHARLALLMHALCCKMLDWYVQGAPFDGYSTFEISNRALSATSWNRKVGLFIGQGLEPASVRQLTRVHQAFHAASTAEPSVRRPSIAVGLEWTRQYRTRYHGTTIAETSSSDIVLSYHMSIHICVCALPVIHSIVWKHVWRTSATSAFMYKCYSLRESASSGGTGARRYSPPRAT